MFQILRAKKIKNVGGLRASLEHMFRERPTFNADPNRRDQNGDSSDVEEAMEIHENIGVDKKRKDNVQAIEYLITASPDFFKDEKTTLAYLSDSLQFLMDKHGQNNLVAYSYHFDETTPHLSVICKPRIKNIKNEMILSAKHFLGGRDKLRKLQDDFHHQVSSNYGLDRGVKRSKAHHVDIQTWYGAGGSGRVQKKAPTEDLEADLKLAQEALKKLNAEVLELRESNARWRNKALQMSRDWFIEDIETAKLSNEALENVKDEIKDSDVLSRSIKNDLNLKIDAQIKANNTPAPTISRGGRGR